MIGIQNRRVAWLLAPMFYFSVSALPLQAQAPDTARKQLEPFFTIRDVYRVVGFTATMLGMASFDKRFAQELQEPEHQENGLLRNTASAFRFMGQPAPQIIGPSLYIVGKLTHHRRVAALGLHGFEAMLLAGSITEVTKIAVGRARPFVFNDSDAFNFAFLRGRKGTGFQSFPSGHTSTAFAVASAVSAETSYWINEKGGPEYLKLLIGGTMYGGAALVGVSRMYHNKHWASDVIGGAAIGTFSGIKVVRYNHRNPKNKVEHVLLGLQAVPGPDGSAMLIYSTAH